MNFISDNTAGAPAEILAAINTVNEKSTRAYGEDQWSQQLDATFSALFERDVRVFLVPTGTAANAIALACLAPAWGAVLCHREAHIERDECGAPEFFSGGAKLALLDGPHAKVTPEAVREGLARNPASIHAAQLTALSISQATERGVCYSASEMTALGEAARTGGLALHVDGARFGNAVAALGESPAALSWRAGVDLMSFGATKGGALGAEAIIAFDPCYADEIERRRKRGGHLLSKSRYAAAQLLAYVEGGLWLKLAARANALAKRIGDAAGAMLSVPVETNQVFIKPGAAGLAALRAANVQFCDWGAANSGEVRFVVSWNQPEAEVVALATLLRSLR